jgi:hypothetical protein
VVDRVVETEEIIVVAVVREVETEEITVVVVDMAVVEDRSCQLRVEKEAFKGEC